MNDYIKKILSKLSNPSWALKNRVDFVNVYGLTEDEYLKGIVGFEINFLKKLVGRFFSTDSYENTGTYDFTFKVTKVEYIKYDNTVGSLGGSLFGEDIRVFVEIEPDAYFEVYWSGESHYITDEFISDSDIGWESESEIKDIIMNILMTEGLNFLNNIRTRDII